MLTQEKLSALTSVEKRIIRLVYADYTATEIAREISCSKANIHYHLQKIYRKLSLKNKRELCLWLSEETKPKEKNYNSCVVNPDLASDYYRDTLLYKQKRARIVNTVYKLKFRCDNVWISSKREWQRELDQIIAVILQELS